jgi:transitional endoplasmic reticulum ATPase
VAALLALARKSNKGAPSAREFGDDLEDGWVGITNRDDDLDDLVLWVEIKKQIKILREGIKEAARA